MISEQKHRIDMITDSRYDTVAPEGCFCPQSNILTAILLLPLNRLRRAVPVVSVAALS